jgi:hypothetical protein
MKVLNHMFSLRKTIALLLILAVTGILSSCKTHEKCPAYGKAQPAKQSSEKNS